MMYFYLFQKRGFSAAVKYYLILSLVYVFIISTVFTSIRMGFYFFLLLLGPTAYLLLEKKKNPYFPLFISLISLALMIFAFLLNDRLLIDDRSEKANLFLVITGFVFVFTMFYLITSFYRTELLKREESLRKSTAALRENEKLLMQNRERLNLAMSTSGLSFWEWDARSQLYTYDRTGLTFMGLGEEDGPFDNNWWLSRIHPDDIEPIMEKYRTAHGGREKTLVLDYRFKGMTTAISGFTVWRLWKSGIVTISRSNS